MVIYLGLIDTSPKKLKYKKARLKIEEKKSMRGIFGFSRFCSALWWTNYKNLPRLLNRGKPMSMYYLFSDCQGKRETYRSFTFTYASSDMSLCGWAF